MTETWQQLLGSLVFYKYNAGIPQRNEKSLAQEMACDGESSTAKPRENYKQKYMELETEKAILQVDNEKIKVEKENLESQLEELTKECSRLKTNFEQMRQDKDEIQKLLDDQSESASKKEKQQHEMALLCQNLQEDKQRLNDQLKTTQDKLRIAKENESLMKLQQVELEQQLVRICSLKLYIYHTCTHGSDKFPKAVSLSKCNHFIVFGFVEFWIIS